MITSNGIIVVYGVELNKMNLMKKVSALAVMVALFAASCSKVESNKNAAISSSSELVAPANFDWQTSGTAQLDMSALLNSSATSQVVKVYSEKGILLAVRNMANDKRNIISLDIPKSESSVIVAYDNQVQDVTLQSGTTLVTAKKKGGKGGNNGPGIIPPGFSCECEGRMRTFSIIYSGVATTTIELHEKQKGNNVGNTLISTYANVSTGDTVVFSRPGNNRLFSQSHVKVNGVTYNIHTSCSVDILGDVYGPMLVISYTNGNNTVCDWTPPGCVDTDGDGCCDNDDLFPNDPTKCDVQYIPGENVYGSYAWEDLWPMMGDFDFNDKVVDRNTVLVLDPAGEVTEVTHKFVVKAGGADYLNGFGFAMPGIAPADVQMVTSSYAQPGQYTTIDAKGLEAGQSEAVVIVYENWKHVVTYTQNGRFFNTMEAGGLETPGIGYSDTIIVTVKFANAQLVEEVLEIDPFLIRNGERGAEIHLPWFGPTDLMNNANFGLVDDASAYPAIGNNWVNANNLPWAIETPAGAFDWPIERIDIVNAYYDFVEWATLGTPANWYSNANRDASKIY